MEAQQVVSSPGRLFRSLAGSEVGEEAVARRDGPMRRDIDRRGRAPAGRTAGLDRKPGATQGQGQLDLRGRGARRDRGLREHVVHIEDPNPDGLRQFPTERDLQGLSRAELRACRPDFEGRTRTGWQW